MPSPLFQPCLYQGRPRGKAFRSEPRGKERNKALSSPLGTSHNHKTKSAYLPEWPTVGPKTRYPGEAAAVVPVGSCRSQQDKKTQVDAVFTYYKSEGTRLQADTAQSQDYMPLPIPGASYLPGAWQSVLNRRLGSMNRHLENTDLPS